jgi:transcriptional regulator with XRE-family HTH domain
MVGIVGYRPHCDEHRGNTMSKSHHPVDVFVGRAIRTRRKSLHLSMEAVADKLHIAYQQLQKYETGMNRVCASRLYELAKELNTTPASFFEGYTEGQVAE